MQRSIRAIIYGRVQGVSYRAHTRRKASELAIQGYVQNQSDGTVLLEAEGPKEKVEALLNWCENGPPLARVERIEVEEVDPRGFEDFVVRR